LNIGLRVPRYVLYGKNMIFVDICSSITVHVILFHPPLPVPALFLWLSRQLELGWTSNHSKTAWCLVSGEVHFFHNFEYGYLWNPMDTYRYLQAS